MENMWEIKLEPCTPETAELVGVSSTTEHLMGTKQKNHVLASIANIKILI